MVCAYFLSHNGLGDNITNIGAINFLLQYYDTIYFICKNTYKENLELIFYKKRVVLVPFADIDHDMRQETRNITKIILNIPIQFDLFVSGNCHVPYFTSRITNNDLMSYKQYNKYSLRYEHISQFYNQIGLDTRIYIEYFDIQSTEESERYYECIKKYKMVFIHTKGSDRSVCIDISEYDSPEYLVICSNKNMYADTDPRYEIAGRLVNLKVAYYIDIIKNSEIIDIIDSCFSCVVYPLVLGGKIKPRKCIINEGSNKIELL